jgi:hypothetical protein
VSFNHQGVSRGSMPMPASSRRIASTSRCTGGWHVMHRQPCDSRRSVHQRVPWQARHHAPGGGWVVPDQLGGCASAGGKSLIVPRRLRRPEPRPEAAQHRPWPPCGEPYGASQIVGRRHAIPVAAASLSWERPATEVAVIAARDMSALAQHNRDGATRARASRMRVGSAR